MESETHAAAHAYRPHQPPTAMTTSQLDEGYSDGAETRSQPDSDMAYTADTVANKGDPEFQDILQRAMDMTEDARKHFVLLLISSLDNKDKLEVNRYIKNLTHFDPALYLPAELVLNVFSYLNPSDLLTASQVSRSWRVRSQDQKLWRACFAREGWVIDKGRLEEFERGLEARSSKVAKRRSQVKDGVVAPGLQRRESRKRTRVEAFSDGETSGSGMEGIDVATEEKIGATTPEEMEGVEAMDISAPVQEDATTSSLVTATSSGVPSTTTPVTTAFEAYQRRYSFDSTAYPTLNTTPTPANFQLAPRLAIPNSNKVSWPFLYKHRRRLEENWDRGKFKTFTLPHADHPDEGHGECIYTIQHTASTLVSGSRDRTIRIWDLDTLRLKREPLYGHEASVLCLQFDERKEQDIIVSGGSDAMIVVWKFSTGEIIKMLRQAHEESVLNLRFDDRYVVTCSKDKTIKIWNRHALERSENSTDIPAHVINKFLDPAQGMGGTGLMIEPFTLLTTLKQHHAAVNAVIIHGNTIVSASGDRTIKAWDLHTGTVTRNYVGHTKGIACVQFDGRRIVSGSSDQTVRVYDAENQAEVACLTGHGHLVRTVQARFGDLDIVSAEELAAQAKRADQAFLRAVHDGMQPADLTRSARRNAGSSRPEDMMVLGARLPPGGGGSRWAKIVSGSYDESVIVWRRDRDGKWAVKKQLHLGNMLRQGRVRRQPALPGPIGQLPAIQAVAAAGQQPQQQGTAGIPAPTLSPAQGLAVAQHANAILQQQQQVPNVQTTVAALSFGAQLAQLGTAIQSIPNHATINTAGQNLATTQNAAATTTATNQTTAPVAPAPQPPPGAAGPNPHAHAAANRSQTDSMRVFKLQFDTRRIICCSQNKVIVGWDFADGDKALEIVGSLSSETA